MVRLPWEVTPQLTGSRLQLIAAIFDKVRKDLLELHEPDKGDGGWSFGCRAYERTCFSLSKLAESAENSSWLKVEFDKLACTLRIDGVPLKFYRGAPEDPTPRALRGGVSIALRDARSGQTNLFQLFGEKQWQDDGWFWLLAIDTHGDGSVSRVVIIQATESGQTRYPWEVPLEAQVAAVAEVTTMQRDGVDLPPPQVGPKAKENAGDATTAEPRVAGDDADGNP